MQVDRYACGCEPGSLRFCHLHSPDPVDLESFNRQVIARMNDAPTLNPMRAALQRSLDRRG